MERAKVDISFFSHLGEGEAALGANVHVVGAQQENGYRRVEEVKHLNRRLDVDLLPRPRAVEVEPELRQRHENVLVKHVADDVAHANVIPATVFENKKAQVFELCNGIVGRIDCLHALLALDADAHVCLLNHGHVVGPVANGQRSCRRDTHFDEINHLPLLVGRDAARHHGLATATKFQQAVL